MAVNLGPIEDNKNKTTDNRRQTTDNILDEINQSNKEILKLTKKINNFVIWQKILGLIKILLILIPIFLAWRLVDSLMNDPSMILEHPVFSGYMEGLMDAVGKNIDPSKIDLNNIDPSSVPEEYRHLLNK